MSNATVPSSSTANTIPDRIRWESAAQILTGVALAALPLLFPLGIGRDYPNHLARVFIQNNLDGSASLAGSYALERFIVPDLAMDLFSQPLSLFMAPYQIGALFNAITLLLLFFAVLALHRWQSGRSETWPCLAAAMLFSAALLWGFMNYLFGAGLALWLFYAWIRTDGRQGAARVLAFSVAQTALFFAHLLGFLFAGYLILVWELARLAKQKKYMKTNILRDFIINMLQFAVPLGLFVYVVVGQEGVGSDLTRYGSLYEKAYTLISPTAALGSVGGPLVLLGCLMLGYWLLRSGHAELSRAMRPIILAVALLVVAMPNMALGVWGLDFRFPFLLLMLIVASMQVTAAGATRRFAELACMALTVTALGAAALAFYRTDRIHQEIREATATMQPGSALLVASDYDPACRKCLAGWANYLHAGSLAAIESHAFVPMLFTGTSFVKASEDRRALDVPFGLPVPREALHDGLGRPLAPASPRHEPERRYWYSWPRHFDYVLWLRGTDETLDEFTQLTAVVESEGFVLYEVNKRSGAFGLSRR